MARVERETTPRLAGLAVVGRCEAGRALAYLFATTAHVEPVATHTKLEQLAEVDDAPTRQMCHWGLQRLQHYDEINIVKATHEVEFSPGN
ncbi:hypothetical protein [Paractinoplanes atraurantiacus]|uniref:hypothetical protein n=1 Tax=Paractinoplanes atraurantiacus TaxID=1036182 RepID=UPI001178887C|nr:hypothetical protein [Actinoplanes atraurantiacus]